MRIALGIGLFLSAAVLGGIQTYASFARAARGVEPPPNGTEKEVTMKTARPSGPAYSKSAYDVTPLAKERVEALAAKLTEDERRILLRKGTEPAFCGDLLDNKKEGTYMCRLCGLPLFASKHKFNSGTGWPSFFAPFDRDHVRYEEDGAHGMQRVEILCMRCDGHLGHVFEDGPKPTGLRYCLNSASLDFVEQGQEFPPESRPVKTETAYFAGGCFWGVEDRFQQLPGVIDSISGYQGGAIKNPTYKQVCSGDTGHAEAVKVVFDPARITYATLLEKFFRFHDPTQMNRQGPDFGTQYRSAIFANTPEQLAEAKAFIEAQQKSERFAKRKIVTQLELVEKAGAFYDAEEYHQDYHIKNGGHCPLPEEP